MTSFTSRQLVSSPIPDDPFGPLRARMYADHGRHIIAINLEAMTTRGCLAVQEAQKLWSRDLRLHFPDHPPYFDSKALALGVCH
jgi:hypothetical protein